jgi:hypothetical protein
MRRAAQAGILYFAIVFALGFALGTARTLLVAPVAGETGAVLLELPLMIAASWLLCGWTLRRLSVPTRAADRIVMGAVAFALLMAAETLVGTQLIGRTAAEQLASYERPGAAIGLVAQIAFALFPLLRLKVAPPAARLR